MQAIIFIASAKRDLRSFPDDVRRVMGFALYEAQRGAKHPAAKPLRGFHGAGVLEIVDDHDGDTYRVVYAVRFGDELYVLHAFQKKAKTGSATPQQDMSLIRRRLALAERLHVERARNGRGETK